MFGFSTLTYLMLGSFLALFYCGAMVAGTRWFGGARSGVLNLGFGPQVFDLNLNRFRYRICAIPIFTTFEIERVRSKSPFLISLLTAVIALMMFSVLLAGVCAALLAVTPAAASPAAAVVREVVELGSAARAGVNVGDTVLPGDDGRLVSQAPDLQSARLRIQNQGQPREVVLEPSSNASPLLIGLLIDAPAPMVRAHLRATPGRLLGARLDHPAAMQAAMVAMVAGWAVSFAAVFAICAAAQLFGYQSFTTIFMAAAVALTGNYAGAGLIALAGAFLDHRFPASAVPFNPIVLALGGPFLSLVSSPAADWVIMQAAGVTHTVVVLLL